MNQVDLAFIFANYALEAGIDTDKALLVEKAAICTSSIWWPAPITSTIRGSRSWRKLHSDAVRNFILTRYKGKIVPGF